MKNKTIIEICISLFIIILLALTSFPHLNNIITLKNENKTKKSLELIRTEIAEYHKKNGKYPNPKILNLPNNWQYDFNAGTIFINSEKKDSKGQSIRSW